MVASQQGFDGLRDAVSGTAGSVTGFSAELKHRLPEKGKPGRADQRFFTARTPRRGFAGAKR